MPVPDFSPGEVLTTAAMDSIGLWLVTTATVSSQTSLIVANCFTSDFKNYRVLGNFSCTTAINLALTLRDSGGDVTLSNYKYAEGQLSYGAGVAWSLTGSTGAANFPTLARTNDNGAESAFNADILGPNTATRTSILSGTTDQVLYRMMNGQYNANTAMTGFKLSATTAFTGTFRVYGYRN
jgi:hypothetical protein